MFYRLLYIIIACSFILAAATGTLLVNSTDTSPMAASQQHLGPLPLELISKVADAADDKTNIKMGMASKKFNEITRKRNSEIRLRLIRKHCGYEKYLQLTSNGHKILLGSIIDPLAEEVHSHVGFIEKLTRCSRAQTSLVRDYGHRLTDLDIFLPNKHAGDLPALTSATNSYLEALGDLFEKKTDFQSISVFSGDVQNVDGLTLYYFNEDFLTQEVETKIINQMSQLRIGLLEIRFKVRHAQLFVNPSIRGLISHQQFFLSENKPQLSNLSLVIFPKFDFSYSDISNNKSNVLQLAKLQGVKELSLPSDLVSEVLSDQYPLERLHIIGSRWTAAQPQYLIALMLKKKFLSSLKFGKFLFPPLTTISIILNKYKRSLTSFSLFFQDHNITKLEIILGTFLSGNNRIRDLELRLDYDATLSHSFLKHAVNLTSYSFEGERTSGAHIHALMTFIAAHSSLKSISLTFVDKREQSADSFFTFYRMLVAAIVTNSSIGRISLVARVGVLDLDKSAKLFAEKTRPLMGRGLIMNSVPVDNIVSDLGRGLKDGLIWKIQRKSKRQILLFA